MVDKKNEKLVVIAKSKGLKIDNVMRKILRFFSKECLVYHSPSGYGKASPDTIEYLAEQLKLDENVIEVAVGKLCNAGILKESRGQSSIGGREYWFGVDENLSLK